jgi:hypothetical protein
MKRSVSFAIMLMIALSAVALAQTSMTPGMQNSPARKSPLADYPGTWIGTFDGHTFVSLRLVVDASQVTGTMLRPNQVQYTDRGDIKSISDEKSTNAVESAVLNGDGLMLTVKDPSTQETTHYLMRLTTAGTAEVKMVAMSMPPGMPKPKPWTLSKVGPSAVAPAR